MGEGPAPQRIQLKRTAGWRMPANTVKVDRSTKWGNPWAVKESEGGTWRVEGPGSIRTADTKEAGIALAVQLYEAWATAHFVQPDEAARLAHLWGRNLACWCKAGTPCHGDVLLKLANA